MKILIKLLKRLDWSEWLFIIVALLTIGAIVKCIMNLNSGL